MPESRMVAIVIAFVTGILASTVVPLPASLMLAAAAFAIACRLFPTAPRATVAVLAVAFAIGAGRYAASLLISSDDISRHASRATGLEGVVTSDPEFRADRMQFAVKTLRALTSRGTRATSGHVLVSIYGRGPSGLDYGSRVRVLSTPYVPRDPTNPGQYSYKAYLARQGIYTCASVRDPSEIRVLRGKQANPLVAAAVGAKHYLSRMIKRIYPQREAPLVVGITLGTYSHLPPDTLRSFTQTGTLHILAASGFNCLVIVVAAAFVLRSMRIGPRWRNVLVVLLIGFYLLMVGPKPSLVRASIMAALALMALPLGRMVDARNIFFTTALAVLLASPQDLFDVGFQLSFLSVWALIWAGPVLKAVLERSAVSSSVPPRRASLLSKGAWKIASTCAAAAVGTVAITLVTAPVIAYHFNYISLTSVPANIAVALGAPALLIGGLASAAIGPVWPLGMIAGAAGAQIARWMLESVAWFGSVPCSSVSLPSPGPLAIAGYYLVLYAAISYVRCRIAEA